MFYRVVRRWVLERTAQFPLSTSFHRRAMLPAGSLRIHNERLLGVSPNNRILIIPHQKRTFRTNRTFRTFRTNRTRDFRFIARNLFLAFLIIFTAFFHIVRFTYSSGLFAFPMTTIIVAHQAICLSILSGSFFCKRKNCAASFFFTPPSAHFRITNFIHIRV